MERRGYGTWLSPEEKKQRILQQKRDWYHKHKNDKDDRILKN